jgi:hypothetical protein
MFDLLTALLSLLSVAFCQLFACFVSDFDIYERKPSLPAGSRYMYALGSFVACK